VDSITQAALGATVVAVIVPKAYRRPALLAGAALGTLPDLDVLIDYGDAVADFTYHRGFSHSLFVLTPLAALIWVVLKHYWSPVREDPAAWFFAISLTLVTHPLLDAHTVYGTQLFWPLKTPPVMWSTIFIIDPLYTIPLLLGSLAAAFWPTRIVSARLLCAGLVLSTVYLGWSWVAKGLIEKNASKQLATAGLQNRPRVTTPTPFNTLLWRIVVQKDDEFLEGFDSLLRDEGSIEWRAIDTDIIELRRTQSLPAIERMLWFTHGFARVGAVDNSLVVTDLRMGQDPDYVFSFRVAKKQGAGWQAVSSEMLPFYVRQRALQQTWQRLSE